VLEAIGGWAERWSELTGEHADPDVVLWSWRQSHLRRDLLPDQRVVVRFEFTRQARRVRIWLLIEHRQVEICRFDPGFGDDLVVGIEDPIAFAHWHMGRLGWPAALRSGGITVTGPQALRQALPTWNSGPAANARIRAEHGLPVADPA
ncbi:MAG TPA: hypothetical protein VH016_02380, partial [Actinomycetota bacterium]|nr:hypothetical protein [Actinomycetota bacterium]